MKKENQSEFRITSGKGFQITFDNNVVVSVQFGGGNYCSNKKIKIGSARTMDIFCCSNAEIAVFRDSDKAGKWLTKKVMPTQGDDVVGYITPNELLKVLNKAANL